MTSATDKDLYAVWAAGRGDAYAGGDQGTLLHYDGEHWSAVVASPPLDATLRVLGIVGLDATTVFALADSNHLYRITKTPTATTTSLEALPSGIDTLQGIGGTPPDQIYAVGASGTIIHLEGSAWQPIDPTMFGAGTIFSAVSAQAARVIAVAGLGTIAQLDGGWTKTAPLPAPFSAANLTSAWIADNGDRYAAGLEISTATLPTLLFAHATTGWQPAPGAGFPANTHLRTVWGASPTAVWAAGDSNLIIYFDGASWKTQPTTTSVTRLNAIGGDATQDIYAVGAKGTILQYGN